MLGEYHLGDCMDYLPDFPDNHFDLAIVDPPYGIGEQGQRNKTGDRPTKKWRNPKSVIYKPFNDSSPPSKEYFKQLIRVSKNQIIWGGNYFSLPISKGWIFWDKKVDIKEALSMGELAWTSFNKKLNVFYYLYAGFRKKEQVKRIHPTQKPIALYKWLLKNYAKEGDLILDTHVGSASSLIACEDMGFKYVGYEKDPDYYRDSTKRLKQHIAQLKIF